MICKITYKFDGNGNSNERQEVECDDYQLLHSEKIVKFMQIRLTPLAKINKYKTVLIVNFDAVQSIEIIE